MCRRLRVTDVINVRSFLVDLEDFGPCDRACAAALVTTAPRATIRADIQSEDLSVEIRAIAKKG